MSAKQLSKVLFICHACKQRIFVKPFVHQTCQHIVCGHCSYKNKSELECLRCRAENPITFARQMVSNGFCGQLETIMAAMQGPAYQEAAEKLFVEAPTANAEATVQRTHLISPFTTTPTRVEPKKSKKERPPTTMETICYYGCCRCILDPIGSVIKTGFKWIMYLVGFLLFIWMINYFVTGDTDLRNLPIFGWIPHSEPKPMPSSEAWQSYTTVNKATTRQERKEL